MLADRNWNKIEGVLPENDWEGAFYITPMQPIITSQEDPAFVDRKNANWHVVGHPDCTALYVGWGDDAILVWEKGMDVPAASAEIEEMYADLNGNHGA